MNELGEAARSYIECGWAVLPLGRNNKVPAIKGGCRAASSDYAQIDAWWQTHPEQNIGIATGSISGGLFVIDVDVDLDRGEDGLAALTTWEREHEALPETVTAASGRGGFHLYFHSDQTIRNTTNQELGIDVRGEGGFVVAPPSLHPNGNVYTWLNAPDCCAVAEADENVLALVKHIHAKPAMNNITAEHGNDYGKRFELPITIPQGGRDDTLFRYASSLQAQGLPDADIAAAVDEANQKRCMPPLASSDIDRIVSSACNRYEKGRAGRPSVAPRRRPYFRKLDKNGNPTGPVLHNVVARELIDNYRACYVDGAPAIWTGTRYESGWDGVNRAIVGLIDDCRIADQKEIRHYVHLMAPRVEASPPWLIAFTNGVLDLHNRLIPMDETMVITNVIPHDYDPGAYDATADRFLTSVSCGSELIRANLEEVIGMCMYRSNDFGQCPVLVGPGANGKSTYINALRYVLGTENVSSLDINILGKPFQAGRLLGRLANLGDDISNERLSGDVLAVFKKVVTGEWIYTDVKNSDGYEFKPFCSLVFSCNEFPSLGDTSEGMLRRLFPIPFDGYFSREDPNYDPRLWDKLRSESAARYLIRLGIEGLRRLIGQNGLTPNGRAEDMVSDVRRDNDSVLEWMADSDLTPEDLFGLIIAEVYERYTGWCTRAGLHPFGKAKFTRKINQLGGYASVPERRNSGGSIRTVRVFRRSNDTTTP